MEKRRESERVKHAQDGDKVAVEEILNDYKNLVRSLARRYILPDGETEDLIQEGMIGLYNAIENFDERKGMSFKNFACLCVKGRLADWIKRYASKKNRIHVTAVGISDIDVAWHDPEEEVISNERGNELVIVMGKVLSDFEFRVFTLYIEGLSTGEICETIGKDNKSVDNAVQRSKKKLRKYLLTEKEG